MALLDPAGLGPEDWRGSIPGAPSAGAWSGSPTSCTEATRCRVVAESASLSDVVREMSAKRLGCTGVVDAGGRLSGS